MPSPRRSPAHARRKRGAGAIGDEHLARVRGGLEPGDEARQRPGDDQLAGRGAGEEEVSGPRGDSGGDLQALAVSAPVERADRGERVLDPDGGAGGALLVRRPR